MACAAKTVYATFEILKESDGNLPSKEVMNQIPGKVNLIDWEKKAMCFFVKFAALN